MGEVPLREPPGRLPPAGGQAGLTRGAPMPWRPTNPSLMDLFSSLQAGFAHPLALTCRPGTVAGARAAARRGTGKSRGEAGRSDAGRAALLLQGAVLPYPIPYALHPHPTPYTIHPAPYTLHPTLYTLHPTDLQAGDSGGRRPQGGRQVPRGGRQVCALAPGCSLGLMFDGVRVQGLEFRVRVEG